MKKLSENQKDFLEIMASALFNAKPESFENKDWSVLARESVFQAVSPQFIAAAEKYLPEEVLKELKAYVRNISIRSALISVDHYEVHKLMAKNDIAYCIIKGEASALYYKEPTLRTMGDVDFLIYKKDSSKVEKILIGNGFIKKDGDDFLHTAYYKPPFSTWEVHNTINGIPQNQAGDICQEYASNIIQTAQKKTINGYELFVPDTFHHGLILLLHTASHLTSSGIGLRHLCDWAVFESSLSDQEFKDIFELKLKACGLWTFAQLLTQLGIKYLKAPSKSWCDEAPDSLLESMMSDILDGGNFGQKNEDRFQQIKYISNRNSHTIDTKSTFRQAVNSVSQKAEAQGKSKVQVLSEYALMLIRKERKPDNKKTISAARERREIYKEFKLFEIQTE